jgi:hypothetical protein
MRSNVARRMRARFSASGENVSPSASSLASRNASIGVRTRSAALTSGTAACRGG